MAVGYEFMYCIVCETYKCCYLAFPSPRYYGDSCCSFACSCHFKSRKHIRPFLSRKPFRKIEVSQIIMTSPTTWRRLAVVLITRFVARLCVVRYGGYSILCELWMWVTSLRFNNVIESIINVLFSSVFGNGRMSSAVDRVIRKVTCMTFAFGIFRLLKKWVLESGQDSIVLIENRHGLDVQGIESRWRRDFVCPSRLALGPIQSPYHVQTVPRFFWCG